MGQVCTTNRDGWLDGWPDEYGSHEPSHVPSTHKFREIMDSHDTSNKTTRIKISAWIMEWGLKRQTKEIYKIPTAMMPQMANFFRRVIWSWAICGKGMIRMMRSFSMFRIPNARKNRLTLMHFPSVPLNCVQKWDTGLQALPMVTQIIMGYESVRNEPKARAISKDGSKWEKTRA